LPDVTPPPSPQETADFVSELLGELADLSRRSGLDASAGVLESAIRVLALEAARLQS
jgi:hypothetical protein